MKTFTDSTGRRWNVVINARTAASVKQQLGVDFHRLADQGCRPLGDLVGDLPRLVDVLYVLCKDQADREGISDADFGRVLAGDCLTGDCLFAAVSAFLDELAGFLPNKRVATVIGMARIRDVLRQQQAQKVTDA